MDVEIPHEDLDELEDEEDARVNSVRPQCAQQTFAHCAQETLFDFDDASGRSADEGSLRCVSFTLICVLIKPLQGGKACGRDG